MKIVRNEPPPINNRFSNDFREFVKLCLTKDPAKRPSAKELLEHKFMQKANNYKEDFVKFVDFWVNKDTLGMNLFNI